METKIRISEEAKIDLAMVQDGKTFIKIKDLK